jgi:hypothetical protein
MANNVSTFILINGQSDLITWLDKKLSSVDVGDSLFDEMSTEQTVQLFYENQYELTYEWMIENVGAKWCHINEWVVLEENQIQIQMTSAWSMPEALIERMFLVCSDVDDECEFSITYEDESLDPIGAMYISNKGSHIEESSYEWPDQDDYETEEAYYEANDSMWEEIGDMKDDLLEQCKLIVNSSEGDEEDDEGSDFYTEDELAALRDWDITLMDGLDEEDEF